MGTGLSVCARKISRGKTMSESWRVALEADLRAMGLGSRWRTRYRVSNRIAFFVYRLRRAEHSRGLRGLKRIIYVIRRYKFERLSVEMGFDIPLGVFGPGLSIAHRGTIVVNGDARVGRNCRIHPGVTIGGDHHGSPVIGDDVFIGPNACILGRLTVGSGATIGPLALVQSDVSPNRTILAARGQEMARERTSWVRSAGRLGPVIQEDTGG
ncbi:MAG: serine O-acetyltransferase [Rhodoglobus sp.]